MGLLTSRIVTAFTIHDAASDIYHNRRSIMNNDSRFSNDKLDGLFIVELDERLEFGVAAIFY